ncbi:MAG: hypothetical protein C0469_14935, partial [Cyanobacteria bacterium DS2.3.42]|nr:hypothetical protein [Cyanobacteria bacterium DS2.3.42]
MELNKRFLSLFSQRFGSAIRRPGASNWRSMSQFHRLNDNEIAESISVEAKTLRACLLDKRSTYLVLTVPSASPFRASEKLIPLLGNLSRIGMIPRLYRAPDSEDVQIYIAFSAPVKTEEMSRKISDFLDNCGFEQESDAIVLHSCERPFALPLQPGFAWMNESIAPKVRREEISLPAAIAMFLRDLENSAVCPQQIESALEAESQLCFQPEILSCSEDIAIAESTSNLTCEAEPELETAINHLSEFQTTEEISVDCSMSAAQQIVEFQAQEAVIDKLASMQLLLFPTYRPPET